MGKTTVNRNTKKPEFKMEVTRQPKPGKKGGKKIVFIEEPEKLKDEPKKPLVDMSDIEFFGGKWINSSDRKSDVSVTKCKDAFHIIFRNKVDKNFKLQKIKIGIWKDKRVYFQENSDGLMILHTNKRKNGTFSSNYIGVNDSIEAAKKLAFFVGNYKLKFDDDNEMYYIEK